MKEGMVLNTLAVAAQNISMAYDYRGMVLSAGPSQPFLDKETGQVVGTVPQWVVSLQLSPQSAVQLHALLGQIIEEYEHKNGLINRLAVPFSNPNVGEMKPGENIVQFGATVEPSKENTYEYNPPLPCAGCGAPHRAPHHPDCPVASAPPAPR